jgi:tetratricopeptide (TPR) repeat protein
MNPADELELVMQQEARLLADGQPADPQLVLRRAELLETLSRFPEALAALQEGTSLRQAQGLVPDPAFHRNEASVLFRMNRYSESLAKVVDSAKQRNEQDLPEDWELSKIRGNCLCHMGRFEDALAAYSRAEQIQLSQGETVYPFLSLNRGAVYQELGRLQDALAEFDRTERLLREQGLPPDHDLAMNRGVVLKLLARYDESLAAYMKAEVLLQEAGLPEYDLLLMNLGEIQSELGNTELAAQYFERAEALRRERAMLPSHVLTFNQALNHHRSGRKDLAVAKVLQTIEEMGPQNIAVKPFYVETLRDWLAPQPELLVAQQHASQPAALEPVPDHAKLYDAFISYRRDPGLPYSMLIETHLGFRKKTVFRDMDDLQSGRFVDELQAAIRHARHMIILMTPDFFERCANEKDVVRAEVATALRCGTHIIPIMMEGFVWPKADSLPDEIRDICGINAMSYSSEFFTAFIDKLHSWMEPRPIAD